MSDLIRSAKIRSQERDRYFFDNLTGKMECYAFKRILCPEYAINEAAS